MNSTKFLLGENRDDQSKNSLPNCGVRTLIEFDRASKRLTKKYSSLSDEIEKLVSELRQNPTIGNTHRAVLLQNSSCRQIERQRQVRRSESDYPLLHSRRNRLLDFDLR